MRKINVKWRNMRRVRERKKYSKVWNHAYIHVRNGDGFSIYRNIWISYATTMLISYKMYTRFYLKNILKITMGVLIKLNGECISLHVLNNNILFSLHYRDYHLYGHLSQIRDLTDRLNWLQLVQFLIFPW